MAKKATATTTARALPGATLSKDAYKAETMLEAIHGNARATWDRVETRPLLQEGNTKIGKRGRFGVMLVSKGLAYHDCPGKTGFCGRACYALSFHYLHAHGHGNGIAAHTSWLAHNDPQQLAELYARDIRVHQAYAKKLVVRLNEAGDFVSKEHVYALHGLAIQFPDVVFYGYSRSWVLPEVADALEAFNSLENVMIRESLDTERHEDTGLTSTAYVGDPAFEPPRNFRCLEQTKGISCVDCGACWRVGAPVVFTKH